MRRDYRGRVKRQLPNHSFLLPDDKDEADPDQTFQSCNDEDSDTVDQGEDDLDLQDSDIEVWEDE